MHKQQATSSSHSFLNRVDEIEHILRERIAVLPGARDRENRPIIFVPARDIATNPDHIRNLMIYLYDVTSDEAKARGFVFIVDMRRGTSWDVVKPILKSLQEYFPANINCVYIIKPEKFLDKYKISTAKYTKFELQMISMDSIPKFVDFCQIIREFGGSLNYDNDEWIEFRREIEHIVHRISEILKNLDRISVEMRSAEMPLDAVAAQSSIQRHQGLYPIISAVPIEDFDGDIHQLRERVLISGAQQKNGGMNKNSQNQQQQLKNGTLVGNPDLLAVFPHLFHLLKSLVRTRNETMNQWEARKTELDHYSQLKLFEQDAENLSQWISKHFHSLTHRFVLIGENEQETNRLLKEHLDFADSVNKIEVSYSQALTVGKRLLEMQTVGINKIENISRQLKDNWTQFLTRIEQRTQLLKLALNAHIKSNEFLKNAKGWQPNVGIDPNLINSVTDLEEASKKHREFQKTYQSSYSEAYEEMNQLMRILKKYFGDSASQLPIYQLIQERIQRITNKLKDIHSIWEARDLTIHNKISSADFVFDLQSVLDWLTQHGEPFLQRKVGIGMDPESANVLNQNHQKFRVVAINTHKNAEQIFRMIHVLDDAEEGVRSDALRKVEELRQRIDKFRRSIEHRTHLLHLAYYFYLHYDEIMEWYSKMDARANYICVVPDSVEQCEKNKETFQTDNDLTVQAYDRVMIEAQQLLQSLKQQRELLSIDNTEAMLHVQNLMRNIENRHMTEKERWQEQRIYLNTALKISTFLRDCFEIKKQLESWRQDLQGLRHSVSNTVEIIKQYHTQNTVKVQQVVSDAMKQLSEISELIQSKALRMISADDPNKPIDEVIVKAARQLQNLEQEVMNTAKDISNRIELNIQLGRLRQLAHEVVEAIEREQMRLLQFYHIPGNQQETDLEYKYFNEFRMEIELFEEKVSRFYNEKERFTALPLLALDSHAETRVRAENLLTEVKAKWQCLVGLLDTRNKLLTAANSYYKYTKLLLPTSQSIEKDLSADRDNDFCKSGNWNDLEHCLEATQERLEKHSNHKQRFNEATAYALRTADQFMKLMQRSGAPKEHIEIRFIEVQQYKDAIRERQTIIQLLWTECNAKIEKCRDTVKIKHLARKVIDWTDRELATCVKIIDTAEHIRKFEHHTNQRKKLEELLERCLELKDLIKVEKYEVRKMLGEARRFVETNPSDFHSAEVEKITISAKTKLENIWNILSESELAVREALNSGLDEPKLMAVKKEQLYLDRYSDSTIEDKLAGRDGYVGSLVVDEVQKKIMEPMRELLKSEKDYIEDLRRCVDVYLYAYKTAGSMCPLAIRGKEREIFGNIDELFQFHSTIFFAELSNYERNPEDVGYCFIAWMEKLKELYADYCLNKEEHNYLICLPEAISMFNEIREQNNLEPCHDLQSLVIKPVQRITKYHILLKELLKHSTKNGKEIKNAYNIVTTIPKLANDRMHLKSFENSQEYNVGDFVMQDTFVVSEPKRYFKRERELQVFLFESNIVFAKREELSTKKSGYVYKDSMLLREIHVVEHIEADNTKFGLRRSAFPYQNDQNTTILKANTEAQRILWVKTLRDLKIDIGRQKTSIDGSASSNRASRDSQSSLILQSLNSQPLEDGQSNSEGNGFNATVIMRETGGGHDLFARDRRILVATENFTATRPDHLSVQLGQKVEMLHQHAEANGGSSEFIKVAALDSGQKTAAIGLVPRRILAPLQQSSSSTDPADAEASTSQTNDEPAMSNKRTSFRRFFTSNQKPESSKSSSSTAQQQQRPSSAANIAAADRPGSSSALRPEDNHHQPCSSVLSPPFSQPSTNTAAISSLQQPQPIPSCSSTTGATDLDLPPPMDQIGSSSALGTEEENANAMAATTMSDEQQNNSSSTIGLGGGGTTAEPSSSSSQQTAGTPIKQMSAEESARLKRSYVLQELVETERAYVQDLASIVEGYISTLKEMELSDEDREKVKIIFANIEQILDFHKSFFCKEIEKSLLDYEAAGNAFIKYERRLHTFYVKYCQNKPKSDFLVSQDNFEQLFADVKDKLGHKVALTDLLIKPVQRITKYQLMLNDILKYTHRAKDRADVLERAHDVMRVVPKACDDMMQVGRLQGFQGNLNAQGRLIFQGTLQISDGGTNQPFKGKDRRVFLFEQSVIIAECIPPRKEYGNPTYNFKNQIMVNKMQLEEQVPDEPLRFVLQRNDPSQPATYVAQATSADEKAQWLGKLSAQLDQQKTFLAALVDPKRYQNQLANSMGSVNIGGKKDSSGSLGTPTSPAATSAFGAGISPTKQTTTQKSSSSKLFGFGKQKS